MNFNFENNTIRFVEYPEQLYEFGVVVKDLAVCLGYVRKDNKARTDTLDELVDKDYKEVCSAHTPSGIQSMSVVWEPRIY